ncbi:hypothetical protein ZWY2020_048261 [Hordeum vulgare]|nr:hypothetical protein ZWY2020_048261 [Hordeum vulgare]
MTRVRRPPASTRHQAASIQLKPLPHRRMSRRFGQTRRWLQQPPRPRKLPRFDPVHRNSPRHHAFAPASRRIHYASPCRASVRLATQTLSRIRRHRPCLPAAPTSTASLHAPTPLHR